MYMHKKKYLCKSEFVWNVHKQVMLKVINFSIGLRSKHAWAYYDSARGHRFWISQTDTSQMNTFPFLHAVIVNVKLCSGWIDLRGNPISVCMSFNFLKQSSSPNGTIKCFISVNMSPLSDFQFERVKFYGWIKFPLTVKGINVPGVTATNVTH